MGCSPPRTGTTYLPRPTGKCREIATSWPRPANHSEFRADYRDFGGRRAIGGRRRVILKGSTSHLGYLFLLISLSLQLCLSSRLSTYPQHHTHTQWQEDLVKLLFTFFKLVRWAESALQGVLYPCLQERHPWNGLLLEFFFFFFPPIISLWDKQRGRRGRRV